MYTRRADLVGFVNGLPLVFIELKASHRNARTPTRRTSRDYKTTIPQLFWHNALIILSNGTEPESGASRRRGSTSASGSGSTTKASGRRLAGNDDPRRPASPTRLLDLVENFTLFHEMRGGLVKVVAKNHQYLGVNNAIEALHEIEDRQGGWASSGTRRERQELLDALLLPEGTAKVPGNWTFVIVTDRKELDDQIYKTFADAGLITEGHVHATSGDHLSDC